MSILAIGFFRLSGNILSLLSLDVIFFDLLINIVRLFQVKDLELTEITEDSDIKTAVHGTYMKVVPQIQKTVSL